MSGDFAIRVEKFAKAAKYWFTVFSMAVAGLVAGVFFGIHMAEEEAANEPVPPSITNVVERATNVVEGAAK
jgi:chitodextrinase